MAKIVFRNNKSRKQYYSMDGFSRKAKRNKSLLYAILIGVIILLIAAIVFIAIKLFPQGEGTPEASVHPSTAPVTGIESNTKLMTDEEGKMFTRVTFIGDNGSTVIIPNIVVTMNGKADTIAWTKELPIIGGSVYWDFYNDDYIPQEPTGAVAVTINPWVRAKDGTEESPIAPVSFNIEIAQSKLELYTPKNAEMNEDGSINTYKNEYTVRFNTSTESKVFINGEDKTVERNKAGLIVHNMSLKPGENNKVVEPKRMPYEKTITFIQPERPVQLEISQMPKETTTDTITVTGKTEPGCTISTDQIQEGPVSIDANGNFTLKLRLKNRGHNSVWIFATSVDGSERTVLEYNVHYKVDIAEYSTKAWKLESNVLMYPDSYKNNTYKLNKVYIEEIVDLYPTVARTKVSLDGIDYTAYIKYTGSFMFEVGATYSIFADVEGSYEGAPLFIIYEGYGFIN